MEIKINVDEVKFKEVIEKELDAFSKEELHELIRNCIIETLHNENVIKNLFIKKETNYYGSVIAEKPTDVVITAAKTVDLSPAFTEIKDNLIDILKNNYNNILVAAITGLIIDGITNDFEFQNRMRNTMQELVTNTLNDMNNN